MSVPVCWPEVNKTIRALCCYLALLGFCGLAACVSTNKGDTSALNINPDSIPVGTADANSGNGANTPRDVTYDPIFVRDLLENFVVANAVDRKDITLDLIAVGKQTIPHIMRMLQRDLKEDARLDLLRLQERISSGAAGEATPEQIPEEVPDTAKDPTKDPAKEGDPSKATGELPPSTSESIKAAEDLIDVGFDQAEVDAFILNRYNTAMRAFRERLFDRTIELCQAILTLAPQSRYRKQTLQLLLDAQTGELTDRNLAGTIGFDRRFARFADGATGVLDKPLNLTLFLTNVGSNAITLELGSGGEGNESLLMLSIELSEESFTDRLRTEGRITLPLVGETVKLEPGQSHQFSIPLSDLSSISPGGGAKQLISRVSTLGSLRPAKLLIHTDKDKVERLFRPILLSRDEVMVMPAGFDVALAEQAPVEFIRKNLETFDAAALHMSHVFIETDDLREVLNLLLADDLRQASTREREARLTLAARLTGRVYSAKPEDWIAWWRDNRFRY